MIRFAKMHGLGNDFMVIDGVKQNCKIDSSSIRKWAHRHTGVGFDQCLIVEMPKNSDVDFHYRIFNHDGEEVYQCGNGARCLALFIRNFGLSHKESITVATETTQMRLTITEDDKVVVHLPPPFWSPQDLPCKAKREQEQYSADINGHTLNFYAVSVGNPHAVVLVDDITQAQVPTLGKLLSEHPFFPEQTNVGFLQISRPGQLKLRVYERGSGETKACGSGAVAAAAISRRYLKQPKKMTVSLPGGDLVIKQDNPQGKMLMTGPATFVYKGELLF